MTHPIAQRLAYKRVSAYIPQHLLRRAKRRAAVIVHRTRTSPYSINNPHSRVVPGI